MTRRQRCEHVLEWFRREMPDADTELHFGTTFQLLVAVMLSAQCTDRRVNTVTPELFRRYPDAAALARASVDDIYALIKSVSYPNAKARHLSDTARMIAEKHGGDVPSERDDLLALPGVGRKTANVIQAVAYGRAAMAVDTHVFRVSRRIGLVPDSADTPLKVEQCLTANIPPKEVPRAHHWLILHGRYVCTARAPKCDICGIRAFCLRRGVEK